MMSHQFADCVRLADEMNGMRFRTKEYGLRSKLGKTKEDIASLEETIV